MDLTSFIVEIWDLDQCFEPFITPEDVEMLFQSKLLWYSQNINCKLIFSKSCCIKVKLEWRLFSGYYLIQRSHYIWMGDFMVSLHGLAHMVWLKKHMFKKWVGSQVRRVDLTWLEKNGSVHESICFYSELELSDFGWVV